MRQVSSSPGRRKPMGWVIAVAVLLAACAAGLWLLLRIAPPVPWRLDLGLLAHNLVPRAPEDLSHRRASPTREPATPHGETTPRSGRTP